MQRTQGLRKTREACRAGEELLHHALLDRLLLGDQTLQRVDQLVGLGKCCRNSQLLLDWAEARDTSSATVREFDAS